MIQELVIPGYGDMTKAVMDELTRGHLAKLYMAERVQRRAAATLGERRTLSAGEVTMQVHPKFYHYWGQRLGYECWEDKQFVREFLRDNPEARVTSKAANPSILVSGWQPNASRSKFHQTYS